jgi:hypothetical protein
MNSYSVSMKMWCRLMVIALIFGGHFGFGSQILQDFEPCDYIDTINITAGHLDQNGNYHYKGNVFKKEWFAVYDYEYVNVTKRVDVKPHIRGCICKIKPCIRLCCFDPKSSDEACVKSENLVVPTYDEDEEIDITGKNYGVLVNKPCLIMFKLSPQDYPEDRWFFMVSLAISLPFQRTYF